MLIRSSGDEPALTPASILPISRIAVDAETSFLLRNTRISIGAFVIVAACPNPITRDSIGLETKALVAPRRRWVYDTLGVLVTVVVCRALLLLTCKVCRCMIMQMHPPGLTA
jgi:hypothetical protein